jgi:hypothetical protein
MIEFQTKSENQKNPESHFARSSDGPTGGLRESTERIRKRRLGEKKMHKTRAVLPIIAEGFVASCKPAHSVTSS